MGAALGGGAAEAAFGADTSNVLVQATKYSAILFFILAFLLYLGRIYERTPANAAAGSALPTIAAPAAPAPTTAVPAAGAGATAASAVALPASTTAPAPAAAPAAPATATPTPEAPKI